MKTAKLIVDAWDHVGATKSVRGLRAQSFLGILYCLHLLPPRKFPLSYCTMISAVSRVHKVFNNLLLKQISYFVKSHQFINSEVSQGLKLNGTSPEMPFKTCITYLCIHKDHNIFQPIALRYI